VITFYIQNALNQLTH